MGWSGRRDLNPRLLAPEASALPGWATSRLFDIIEVEHGDVTSLLMPFRHSVKVSFVATSFFSTFLVSIRMIILFLKSLQSRLDPKIFPRRIPVLTAVIAIGLMIGAC